MRTFNFIIFLNLTVQPPTTTQYGIFKSKVTPSHFPSFSPPDPLSIVLKENLRIN